MLSVASFLGVLVIICYGVCAADAVGGVCGCDVNWYQCMQQKNILTANKVVNCRKTCANATQPEIVAIVACTDYPLVTDVSPSPLQQCIGEPGCQPTLNRRRRRQVVVGAPGSLSMLGYKTLQLLQHPQMLTYQQCFDTCVRDAFTGNQKPQLAQDCATQLGCQMYNVTTTPDRIDRCVSLYGNLTPSASNAQMNANAESICSCTKRTVMAATAKGVAGLPNFAGADCTNES